MALLSKGKNGGAKLPAEIDVPKLERPIEAVIEDAIQQTLGNAGKVIVAAVQDLVDECQEALAQAKTLEANLNECAALQAQQVRQLQGKVTAMVEAVQNSSRTLHDKGAVAADVAAGMELELLGEPKA